MSQNEGRARHELAVRDRLLAQVARPDAPAADLRPAAAAPTPVTAPPPADLPPADLPLAGLPPAGLPAAELPPVDLPADPPVAAGSAVDAVLVGDDLPPLAPLPPDVARLAARRTAPATAVTPPRQPAPGHAARPAPWPEPARPATAATEPQPPVAPGPEAPGPDATTAPAHRASVMAEPALTGAALIGVALNGVARAGVARAGVAPDEAIPAGPMPAASPGPVPLPGIPGPDDARGAAQVPRAGRDGVVDGQALPLPVLALGQPMSPLSTEPHLVVRPDLRPATAAPRPPGHQPPLPPAPGDQHRAHAPVTADVPADVAVPRAIRTTDDAWSDLGLVALDEDVLDRSLVITAARTDPAHGAFDVLRTRLLGALAEHGWSRVGITSPTKGCGKSFTAMNLAVALSRYDGRRTILMDMDMRLPSLARSLGMTNPGSLGDVLRGLTPPAAHLRRVAPNRLHIGHLVLGLNSRPEPFAAELFQDPRTAAVLAAIRAHYRPDVMLFDLPPALAQDDVIAFRPHFDCILMVVGGGMTTAREVRESIRRLGEDKPVVGIVLNRAEGQGVGEYAY